MFGTIAKFFKRSPAPAPAPARTVTPQAASRSAAAPSQGARTLPRNETPQGRLPAHPARVAAPASGEFVVIPYAAIIRGVPQELWGKLAPAGAGAAEFVLSREAALEQLPQGAVKVGFSELRRTAPSGLFANNTSQDSRLIDLPLAEVLAQLHPDAIARRPNQHCVQVSDEVPDLFGNKGERLAPLRVMDKQEAAASIAATRQNAPSPRQVMPGASPSVQEPPAKSAVRSAALRSTPLAPAAPVRPNIPLPAAAPRPTATAAIPLPKPAAPASAAAAKPLPRIPPPKSVSPAPGHSNQFFVAVDAVAAGWPEEIRQELARMKLPGARLAVPAAEICDGLKRRLVQFPWGSLRRWIQPQPPVAGASPFDHVIIELPLPVITPLFLDHIRSSPKHNNKVSDSETITEFFRRTESASPIAADSLAPVAAEGVPAAAATDGVVELPLAQICSAWPDAVKHDIAQFNLGQAVVRIPCEYVDAGLKTGKVEFTWRQVCAWLQPSSPPAQLSINGELRVVFPLNFIAPLFIKRNPAAQAQRKTRVDQEIPDLFSAGGLMPPTATPAAPIPTPAASASVPAPVAAPAETAAPKGPARSLAELFNEPDKRSWTPNDIVHRTAQLPGVAGALIALQDGLLVAACMPPNSRTETIAAFVPQIFGRISQYTRELQMGDTKGVGFTVESGTLQVFNAGIIYFAALSKPGVQLPIPELHLIATELSRHTK